METLLKFFTRLLEVAIVFLIFALILIYISFFHWALFASAQVPNDGIPERLSTKVPTNVAYWIPKDSNGNFPNIKLEKNTKVFETPKGYVISEPFKAPEVLDTDFGRVRFIDASPIDPSRNFINIPTFGLAKWHWWLFGDIVLPRAQRQMSACVGAINENYLLLGKPPIDSPSSPDYIRIISSREYHVPFEPIQRTAFDTYKFLPPTREDAIGHIFAAVATVNNTVVDLDWCEGKLVQSRAEVQQTYRKR